MSERTIPPPEQELPSTQPLMQLVTGVWAAKTLAAAVDLGLFTFVSHQGRVTVADVVAGLQLPVRPAGMLVTACAALGLLRGDGDGFVNAPLAEEYLVDDRPLGLTPLIRMLDARNYPGWLRLAEALRGDRPTTWEPEEQSTIFERALDSTFWDGMYALSALSARRMSTAVDLHGSSRLLDVGGGGAAYAIELCRRHPDLAVTIYDLPLACAVTRSTIEQSGMDTRISLCPGDFFADARLPDGHDTVLLSMVLHDWNPDQCRAILTKCFAALPRGGRVLICELFVDDTLDGPPAAALMNLNMLVETAEGRNYTRAEYLSWLTAVGFADVHVIGFDGAGANGVAVGTKA